jgi:DNA-binding response OmpR family regulator
MPNLRSKPNYAESIKHNILIVDDEDDTALYFKIVLEGAGFYVDVFNDPSKALNNFKPNFYDLLLIDIKMPGMSGFQLHNALKVLDDSIKVCFITAFEPYYQSLKEEYELDVKCFIKKPISEDELISRVVEHIITSD